MSYNFVWLIINFPMAMMVAVALIAQKMQKRSLFAWRIAGSAAVITGVAFAWNLIDKYVLPEEIFSGDSYAFPDLNYFWDSSQCLIIFVAIVGATILCFDCNFWSSLFAATAGYCLQHVSFNLYRILSLCLKAVDIRMNEYVNSVVFSIFYAAVFTAFYFLVLRQLLRRNGEIIVENKVQVIISTIVLFMTVFLYKFVYPPARVNGDLRITVGINLFAMIACLLGLFVEFGLYANKTIENERNIANQLLHDEREQYIKEKATFDLINIKSHDLKYQIAALENKFDKGSLDEIKKAVETYDSTVKTGNDALDVVLTGKSIHCQSKGINLVCMVDGELLSFMSDVDIYTLFGNALDNAIEAVEDLEANNRYINAQVKSRGQNVLIHFENFYTKSLVFRGGLPVTTKENKEYHGFGTKSIKHVVDKYGGTMVIKTEEELFELNILIPIKR